MSGMLQFILGSTIVWYAMMPVVIPYVYKSLRNVIFLDDRDSGLLRFTICVVIV